VVKFIFRRGDQDGWDGWHRRIGLRRAKRSVALPPILEQNSNGYGLGATRIVSAMSAASLLGAALRGIAVGFAPVGVYRKILKVVLIATAAPRSLPPSISLFRQTQILRSESRSGSASHTVAEPKASA
jgi:hypothetical protein